jgi:hypothetical protein
LDERRLAEQIATGDMRAGLNMRFQVDGGPTVNRVLAAVRALREGQLPPRN